ncbi:MAG TPA: pitrilysin family protein [Gemmatimonadaceae bacterium]|nr:pitrilysin family protein [Gemmatimonadaceae bacterium]
MVTAVRPRPAAPRLYRFPSFTEEVLPSGLRLVVAPVEKLPVVTVLLVIDAGSTLDPPGKEGLATLTADVLLEGTSEFDGAQLTERFEQLGTAVESGADWDSTFVKLTVLAEHLDEATALLGDAISNPAFPEREIERLKAERLAEILQLETEPRGLADEKFTEFLYAAESRYAKPDAGDAESVAALSRTDVEKFFRSQYRARSTTVVVAGATTRATARALVAKAFEKWPDGAGTNRALVASPRASGRVIHIVNKPDAPQSELRVGHVGLPRKHPDFFPALVMNAVLGGLFGSRINMNLREAHGYTYGASSYYDWRRGPGPFVVATAVQSDVTAPALREIFSEIDRIRAAEILDEELSLARDYLDGVFPIRYETTTAIASALANLVIYGLSADYYDTYRSRVREVSTEHVLQAARDHLHPDQLQTVIVGDATAIKDSVVQLGFGDLRLYSV